MLHGRNKENILHKKEHFSPHEKESIVPAMQYGYRAKPLYDPLSDILIILPTNYEPPLRGGGGVGLPHKKGGVLLRNFEKSPYGVSRSCIVVGT